jgi:hypothetical protein
MRVAQVAPLYESVPPKMYGGTERVVSYLTEELVQLGHDVTLFASGDSMTSATLVPMCPNALRLNSACIDQLSHHVLMLERVYAMKEQFELFIFILIICIFPLTRREKVVSVTTLHGRLTYRSATHLPGIWGHAGDFHF